MEEYKKKYEQALENLKKIKAANKDNKELVDFIEYEYPELKESEDERIRRDIIRYLKKTSPAIGENIEKMLAWLEKQGEQKSTDEIKPKFKVGDTIRLKGSTAEYTIESISGGCYHGKGWGLDIDCDEDYELVEQKPAWTGYDEKAYEIALLDIDKSPSITKNDTIDWLKSLKKRVQPQTKQEWSEEDKRYYDSALWHIKNSCGIEGNVYNWLKSLKERMKGE